MKMSLPKLLVLTTLVLPAFLFGIFTLLNGCQTPSESSEASEVETNPAFPGTIVCYQPWNASPSNSGAEIYRDTIGRWSGHPMWSDSPLSARTNKGYVTRSGITVAYDDGDGNMVYLVNYPCRITLPTE
jgi:hypothetical protein